MALATVGPAHSEAWFAARSTRVTASLSAHLLLEKRDMPWKLEEAELAARISGSDPLPPSPPMAAGTHFEEANLEWFGICAGAKVRGDGALTIDTDRPWLGASFDGWAEVGAAPLPDFEPPLFVNDGWGEWETGLSGARSLPEGTHLVEMKQTKSKNRSRWNKASPPPYYEVQVRHQLMVADGPRYGLLVCKVDAFGLYVHVIERDIGYEDRLDERCYDFWKKWLQPG